MRQFPFFLFLSLFFFACQEVQDARRFKNPNEIVNPNGDSELSLVMRYIHFEANKIGRALEEGKEVNLDSLKFLSAKLSTSIPTDSNVLDETYYSFAGLLEEHVKKMDTEEAVPEFNSMVKACVACHKNTCPGPITKIQALRIKG